MQDEMTAAGREHWLNMLVEAERAAQARRCQPDGPGPLRRGLARALRTLAGRLDAAGTPAPQRIQVA